MSHTREYEVTVLIQSKMDEESRTQFINNFAEILTHGEGESAKPIIHHWGNKELAYEIRKNTDAYYVFYEAQLDGTRIRDIERDLNYNENILRYLFVRKEEQPS